MSASVLIVEDEKILLDVYKLLLTTSGFDVETASNGLEALQKVEQKTPDLIMLDLSMPRMDGKGFLRAFDRKKYPDTRIVVCTNLSSSSAEREVLPLGAERVVLKASLGPNEFINLAKEMTAT